MSHEVIAALFFFLGCGFSFMIGRSSAGLTIAKRAEKLLVASKERPDSVEKVGYLKGILAMLQARP